MNELRVDSINLQAPYKVLLREDRPGIVSRLDNPRLSDVLQEFDETVSLLFD